MGCAGCLGLFGRMGGLPGASAFWVPHGFLCIGTVLLSGARLSRWPTRPQIPRGQRAGRPAANFITPRPPARVLRIPKPWWLLVLARNRIQSPGGRLGVVRKWRALGPLAKATLFLELAGSGRTLSITLISKCAPDLTCSSMLGGRRRAMSSGGVVRRSRRILISRWAELYFSPPLILSLSVLVHREGCTDNYQSL
jgi:hypothetical protein